MSPRAIRVQGLAAIWAGAVALAVAPFYALSHFATPRGRGALATSWVAAWNDAARPALSPLLTFADADTVRTLYAAILGVALLASLVGTFGLHERQKRRTSRAESMSWSLAAGGAFLLAVGAFMEGLSGLEDIVFLVVILPSLALLAAGSTLLGFQTLTAHVLPKAAGWLLVFGGALGVPVFAFMVGHWSGGIMGLAVAWITTGTFLRASPGAPVVVPSAGTIGSLNYRDFPGVEPLRKRPPPEMPR